MIIKHTEKGIVATLNRAEQKHLLEAERIMSALLKLELIPVATFTAASEFVQSEDEEGEGE